MVIICINQESLFVFTENTIFQGDSNACESWTCAFFSLYTTGEETFAIYKNNKQKKQNNSVLDGIHRYRFLNMLKGFQASVREGCYNTKLDPSLSS